MSSEITHLDMSKTLKEMLRINNSSDASVVQTNHVGSGDGLSISSTADDEQQNGKLKKTMMTEEKNNQPGSSTEQTILMKDVNDGESVTLSGKCTTIVSSSDAEIDSTVPASNKIKTNKITKFEWENKYYPGSLISVTDAFIAYIIKGHPTSSVRVVNRHNPSDRVLLKGFEGDVCDVAFSSSTSNILAAIDSHGNVIVWQLDKIAGNIRADKKLHIPAEEKDARETGTHRISWIPCVNTDNTDSSDVTGSYDDKTESAEQDVQRILVVSYCNVAEVWDLDNAFQVAKNNVEVRRADLTHVVVTVDGHDDDICDCELSPLGNVLAVASYDGFVRFWQIQFEDVDPPSCLHMWKPHDGRPVSAVKFCDNKQRSEFGVYWRFLLTGCDRNSELKMWCSVTWNCLQVIKFQPSTPAHAIPELNVLLYVTVDFIAITDIHRKVLYIMQCKTNIEEGKASLTSITAYQLAQPLLSVAFVDAHPYKSKTVDDNRMNEFDDDEDEFEDDSDDNEFKSADKSPSDPSAKKVDGVLMKLYGIQPKSLLSLDIQFLSNEDPTDPNGALPETLTTYNSTTDDIKDTVSLGSVDDNNMVAADNNAADEDSSDDVPVMGDECDSDIKHNEQEQNGATDKIFADAPPADDVRTPSPLQLPHSSTSDNPIAPDVTQAVTPQPPVLLTPEAFMAPLKSNNPAESANSSFTAVTPFTNRDDMSQMNQDDPILMDLTGGRSQLSNLLLSPSTNADETQARGQQLSSDNPTTPPSSPALPRASSSPPEAESQQAVRVVLVKSPDLISSTSTLDGENVVEQSEALPSMPPASQPNILGRNYPVQGAGLHAATSAASADVFPPVLVPVTTSWPKAPDVTMSRSTGTRTPPPSATEQASSSSSQQNQPSHPLQDATADRPHNERHDLDSYELIRVLTDLQNQQRDLMTGHQRELQTMHKKQNQVQKQNDSSIKRSEQLGDRLEKSVKSVAENQRRLLNDLKTMQTGMTEATSSKMERIIKGEMKRTVVPGLTQSMEPLRDQLAQSVIAKLTATDAVMKDNIAKLVKSKETVDCIASSTSKAIHGQIVSSLPEILFTTVVPSFERSTQTMFQQLSATYLRGMEETVNKIEKQLQHRLKPEQDRLQGLIKEAHDAASQLSSANKKFVADVASVLQKQIPAEVEKALVKCEERIYSKVEECVKRQNEANLAEQRIAISDLVRSVVVKAMDEKLSQFATADSGRLGSGNAAGVGGHLGPRPQGRPSILDQQQQILKHLQQGNVNTAFQTALTASDLSLVMYVCETVDPAIVFGVSPCPLQQPILLSLIQQLSSDLSSKTELKLKYLQEAVMNLDRRHQVTQEYMHSVLSALVQKLQTCAQGPLDKPTLGKELKMLAMAAQSLLK